MTEQAKILLVDDREENLAALEGLLGATGARLLTARSGREALDLLLEHDHVALALIDVRMPEMDGFELAELMRGTERTREIPLIFVTAGVHDQSRIFKGYESGAVDFLVKPLDAHILASKVGVFLQLHRQKQLLAERVGELEEALAERRRAEEALRRSEALLREADQRKNEFLAALSHELRNPLAPISNSLYLLSRAPPDPDRARRAFETIERQVAQLTDLVNDLLDVTRITRNKITLRKERLELNALIARVVEDHRSLFAKSRVGLEVCCASGPIHVDGDSTRLAQVVGNLLHNAAKFSRAGGRTRVSVSAEEGQALIRVADEGIGMDGPTLARLFEPFMQAERSLDRSKGGLGLGLALVKGLTELHGGRVSARSEGLGRGTEFLVRLPLAAPSTARAEPARADASPVRRRVLIIEDNVDAAESLRDVLGLAGHEVEVAFDGPQGIEKARSLRPEVVLCDIGLPGMDGYQVARDLRADCRLAGSFLVALSGYALPEDIDRAFAAGFRAHLAKPPDLAQLEALLARAGSENEPAARAGAAVETPAAWNENRP